MIENGDLEGLLLTGLTNKSVDLFEKFIDLTGDFQTAALILPIAVPKMFIDERVTRWVEWSDSPRLN